VSAVYTAVRLSCSLGSLARFTPSRRQVGHSLPGRETRTDSATRAARVMSCSHDESEQEALSREAEARAAAPCHPDGACGTGCSGGTGAHSDAREMSLGGASVGGQGGADARRQCGKCKARSAQACTCPRHKTSMLRAASSLHNSVTVCTSKVFVRSNQPGRTHLCALDTVRVCTGMSVSATVLG